MPAISVPLGYHLHTENSAVEVFDATTGNMLVLHIPID